MTDDEDILPGLCDERYEEIKSRVADLYEQYRICSLPINAFEIAARMGVHVVPYATCQTWAEKLPGRIEDGFSFLRCGEFNILHNDRKAFGRQNWTLMHEIAHIFLGHKGASIIAEREAEFFAKYALIPPPLINMLGITTPKEIQIYFIASREAAENGMMFYQKWLRYHTTAALSKTEKRILRLFSVAQ